MQELKDTQSETDTRNISIDRVGVKGLRFPIQIINKHPRFSYTPAHTHHFIELNFLFNGQCTQRLNGDVFHLEKGQLLLLDSKVIQQIDYVGAEDILIDLS